MYILKLLFVCFSHPQGGRDEGNYLDDALVRQDAQVGRTAASFFQFSSLLPIRQALVGGQHLILQCILARLGYVL